MKRFTMEQVAALRYEKTPTGLICHPAPDLTITLTWEGRSAVWELYRVKCNGKVLGSGPIRTCTFLAGCYLLTLEEEQKQLPESIPALEDKGLI